MANEKDKDDDKNNQKDDLTTLYPEFKPGDKPYCSYGNIILNKNVPWIELIVEILDKSYTLKDIADFACTEVNVLWEVLKQNHEVLPFRAGARIITLHCQIYPEYYVEEEEEGDGNAD